MEKFADFYASSLLQYDIIETRAQYFLPFK